MPSEARRSTPPVSLLRSSGHLSGPRRHAAAALIVLVATLLRMGLAPWIGPGVPFLLYYPAITAAGWIGGLGGGVTATVLSAVIASYALIPPTWSFAITGTQSVIQLALFILSGLFISSLTGALHRARLRAEEQAAFLEAQQKERVQLLAATEQALRQAEEASRSKDEFLATVSHELRTPLNAMLGWAQLLQADGSDPEKVERGLRSVIRNARQQAHLIDDLLDVSRIVSGKMRLDVRPVEPAKVVEAAVEAIRPAAEAKQIRVSAVLDPRAGPVAGDPDRLQQVVWNLLSNSLKFTPKGGRVEVRLERVNSHIEILVADNGIGISLDFLPHVFDRFRQLDSSTTRTYGGLGLGLSIVRHLVELHGGSVEARSAGEGQGTTFIVRLPLALALPSPDEAVLRAHPVAGELSGPQAFLDLGGIRVLIVDDQPDARETLQEILERCHAEARAVGSAEEALRELASFRPDVLLSDLGMPGMDGYELIRRVRELPPEQGGRVPAAALTAFTRSEDRRQALLAGFENHLAKPVDIGELTAMVASLARRDRGGRRAPQSAPSPPSPG